MYRIDADVRSAPKTSILLITGPACPVCSKTISPGSLQTQLEVQIREHIAKYYEGWTVCDDPTCNYSTRMMGVYGRRCLRSGCKGRVAFKVTQYIPTHSGTITDRNISTPILNYTTSYYTSCRSLTAIKPSAPSKILSHVVCNNPVFSMHSRSL